MSLITEICFHGDLTACMWYNFLMRSDIEAVAFDLDGTLYPDYRLNVRLIPFVVRHLRFMLAFGKARRRLREAGRPDGELSLPESGFYAKQAALTGGFLGIEADIVGEKIETLIYRGFEPYFKKIKLFPGVVETLEAFRAAGLKLGLLSDFPPRAKVKYLGIDSYWDAVLSSEEIGMLKPDKLPFEELARALNTVPQKILYVGNSFRCDVKGAKNAGMSAALIKISPVSTGTSTGPADFVFSGYRQLRDYVIN